MRITRTPRSMRMHRRSPAADDGADPRSSGRSRQPVNTAVAPFELQASISQYSIQSQTMTTYIIQSIHLGPCFDQHPACGLVAILGSLMERGGLGLRLEGWGGRDALGRSERGDGRCRGGIDEESNRSSQKLGVDDLRICDGMGAAHANRLQGLAISRSRKVVYLKWIAMHAI